MCIVYHLYFTISIYRIIFTKILQMFHLNYISSLQQGHTILVEIPECENKYAHQFMEYLPNAVSLIIVMNIGNAHCTNNYLVICSFYFYIFLFCMQLNNITEKIECVAELRLIKQTDVFTNVNVQQ